jgi:glycosyltransferase involved in cell wall biosynthesis
MTMTETTPGDASPRTLITISIPVYNEADNIDRLYAALHELSEAEANYDFEFLFTDNASKDDTFQRLEELAKRDPRIRILRLSRNFGFQKSILTNFLNARGAAAAQIDADLQDPPSLISEFLREWEKGYKVVYGVRRHRRESWLMRASRSGYYRLVSWLSHTELPRNAGDFRLIDRMIIEHMRLIHEQTPYLRGLIAGFGYPQKGIVYDRDARKAGVSKFRLFNLIELGIDGITAQSTRPLRLITMFGFLISILSILGALGYFLAYIVFGSGNTSGFTTIILVLLFMLGLNALFLGLIGEYVGRVFNNTRGLPISIIEAAVDHRDRADTSTNQEAETVQ